MSNILSTFTFLFETDADKATAEMKKADVAADELARSVEKVGKVDAAGMQKLSAALNKAKVDYQQLNAEAAHAKFSGNTAEAEKLAKMARSAKIEAERIAGAMNRVKLETAGAAENGSRLATSFTTAARSLIAPLAALVSIGTVTSFVKERAREIRELEQVAIKLRGSVGEVDAFRRAVVAAGGETAGATDSLVKFGEKLNEAAADKASGAAKDFAAWGFAIKGAKGEALDATAGMLKLAESFEKVSKAEALARIKKLGIEDAGTIELLMKGRKALEDRIEAEKRLGVVTEEQAQAVREYRGQMGQLGNMLESFGNRLLASVLPSVTKFFASLQKGFEWMAKNETLVKGFFIGLTIAMAPFIASAALAVASILAFAAPFLAVAAAVAAVGVAFALAYEDVQAFLNGQPSLIGELAKEYQWFGDFIKALGPFFTEMSAQASAAWAAVKHAGSDSLAALRDLWGTLKPFLTEGWAAISAAGSTAWEALKSAGTAYFSSLMPLWEAFGNAASLAADVASAAWAKLGPELQTAFAGLPARWEEFKTQSKAMFEAVFGDAEAFKGKMVALGDSIGSAFTAAAGLIGQVWSGIIGTISSGINAAINGLRTILGLAGSAGGATVQVTGTVAGAAAAIDSTRKGQILLKNADGTPINSQTPSTVNTNAGGGVTEGRNVTSTVNVGGVTINTAATDADGIARAVDSRLKSHIGQTQNNLDDGVAR